MNLILETERIFLKKFTKNDFNLVFELDGNSEVMQYITLGKTKTIEQIRILLIIKIWRILFLKNYGIFAAYLKSNNSFIGWFQFEKDKHIENAIELGWRLKKEYWNNGYATEVGSSLVKKAKNLNKKAVARAMIENRASIRVMEKIGLKFVKEFWGDYDPHSGTFEYDFPDVFYES